MKDAILTQETIERAIRTARMAAQNYMMARAFGADRETIAAARKLAQGAVATAQGMVAQADRMCR